MDLVRDLLVIFWLWVLFKGISLHSLDVICIVVFVYRFFLVLLIFIYMVLH
jgi:hypothetical protein